MGIANQHVLYLAGQFAKHGLGGRCLTLGRMTVLPTLRECVDLARMGGAGPSRKTG